MLVRLGCEQFTGYYHSEGVSQRAPRPREREDRLKEQAKTKCLSGDRDDVIERGLLVFGLRMQVVMDAKQLVPVMGGDAATWRALKRGLARLELAGYVERNPFGPRRFYRRTLLGTELAH